MARKNAEWHRQQKSKLVKERRAEKANAMLRSVFNEDARDLTAYGATAPLATAINPRTGNYVAEVMAGDGGPALRTFDWTALLCLVISLVARPVNTHVQVPLKYFWDMHTRRDDVLKLFGMIRELVWPFVDAGYIIMDIFFVIRSGTGTGRGGRHQDVYTGSAACFYRCDPRLNAAFAAAMRRALCVRWTA